MGHIHTWEIDWSRGIIYTRGRHRSKTKASGHIPTAESWKRIKYAIKQYSIAYNSRRCQHLLQVKSLDNA